MPNMTARMLLVGIDEAGYGPLLGPLVISAVAFEAPPAAADGCLWKLLNAGVTNRVSHRDRRVCILDSKKLFSQKEGIGRLERTVLACLGAWRGAPPHLRGLLGLVAPETISKLDEYPWYRQVDCDLPVTADAAGVRIASTRLSQDMASAEVRIGGVYSEVLPEGHFNRMVDTTRNKATVLSSLTLRLIRRVSEAFPDHEIRIFIDKQGARDHYGPALMKSFDYRRLRVLHEDHEQSIYEMSANGYADWRISFREKGESHHLPIALASCVSKYIREVFMGCFNRWWNGHLPAVRPTAGYYGDGQRFLKEIGPTVAALGIQQSLLIRKR